jgi:hypothetical protein
VVATTGTVLLYWSHGCEWAEGAQGVKQRTGIELRQTRFSFDNYLGMVLFALVSTCFLYAVVILLGPQMSACFCPAEPVGAASSPRWGCCGLLPEPGVIQALPIVFFVLLAISLLVAVVGIILGRTRRTTIDVYLVYALELCPFLTLIFVGIAGCIVFLISFLPPG